MRTEDASSQPFAEERSCIYRGETYSVRDNGAIFRRALPAERRRRLDEIWTFGSPSASDGYMSISMHKVHRVVATAFHGEQPSPGHIVDHIDTNRRNNRADNLRWVTRLENILINPITAKRVVALYGSVEEFLADPSNPKYGKPSADFEWMRSVTAAETRGQLSPGVRLDGRVKDTWCGSAKLAGPCRVPAVPGSGSRSRNGGVLRPPQGGRDCGHLALW